MAGVPAIMVWTTGVVIFCSKHTSCLDLLGRKSFVIQTNRHRQHSHRLQSQIGNHDRDDDDDVHDAFFFNSLSSSDLDLNFGGAGEPRPELLPQDLVPLLMTALKFNHVPTENAGLRSMWAFSGDEVHFVFKNNVTEFIESALQTAQDFPTSFYGAAMYGPGWQLETPLNRIGGSLTSTTRLHYSIISSDSQTTTMDTDSDANCWIATQVIKTVSSDGRIRRWQWELRKRRRPPKLNCWYVESIGSSDRKGQFEAE